MTDTSFTAIALLTLVAFLAGTIDAIAGGGGLLTLPALLFAGLPPHLALGTNKGQSVFGSCAAMIRFARGGLLDRRRAALTFPLGLAGSAAGALLVLAVPPRALRSVVLVLLIVAAAFVALRHATPSRTTNAPPVQGRLAVAGVIALAVGAYDGFFGPGTGTFLVVAFAALLGDGLTAASAAAKVVNFASNLAAMALFASEGVVLWRIALPMAAGQVLGGWLGAHLTLRRGDALVRRAAVITSIALAAKLAWDMRQG